MACQMVPAVLDTVTVDLAAGEGNVFRANGSTVVKPGFMAVYQEDIDDKPKDAPEGAAEDEKLLPPMEQGRIRRSQASSARSSTSPNRRRASPKRAW